ncbi:hypothetical protein I4U23_011511 [Adineta vaga]|nr:hypothetical protein I4U23_011511 [Adineta vaga]
MKNSTFILLICFICILQIYSYQIAHSKSSSTLNIHQLAAQSRKCLCNCCYDPRSSQCTPRLTGIIYYENNTYCADIDCEIRCSKRYTTCDTSQEYHINEAKCHASSLQQINIIFLLFSMIFIKYFKL